MKKTKNHHKGHTCIAAVVLALIAAFSLTACSSGENANAQKPDTDTDYSVDHSLEDTSSPDTQNQDYADESADSSDTGEQNTEYVDQNLAWDSYEELLDFYINATFSADVDALLETMPDGVFQAKLEDDENAYEGFAWGLNYNKECLDNDVGTGWSVSYEETEYTDEMDKQYLSAVELDYWSEYDMDVAIQQGYHVEVSFTLKTQDGKEYTFIEVIPVIRIDDKWYIDATDTSPGLLYNGAFCYIDNDNSN